MGLLRRRREPPPAKPCPLARESDQRIKELRSIAERINDIADELAEVHGIPNEPRET